MRRKTKDDGLLVCAGERRGTRVEWRLRDQGRRGLWEVGVSYISTLSTVRSVIIFEKFSVQDPVGLVSVSSSSSSSALSDPHSIHRSTDPQKSIGPCQPHIPASFSRPHPFFFFYSGPAYPTPTHRTAHSRPIGWAML